MDTCWCVLNVGIVDELLGVAGMIIVSQWIIPENSLRWAPVRIFLFQTQGFIMRLHHDNENEESCTHTERKRDIAKISG